MVSFKMYSMWSVWSVFHSTGFLFKGKWVWALIGWTHLKVSSHPTTTMLIWLRLMHAYSKTHKNQPAASQDVSQGRVTHLKEAAFVVRKVLPLPGHFLATLAICVHPQLNQIHTIFGAHYALQYPYQVSQCQTVESIVWHIYSCYVKWHTAWHTVKHLSSVSTDTSLCQASS